MVVLSPHPYSILMLQILTCLYSSLIWKENAAMLILLMWGELKHGEIKCLGLTSLWRITFSKLLVGETAVSKGDSSYPEIGWRNCKFALSSSGLQWLGIPR